MIAVLPFDQLCRLAARSTTSKPPLETGRDPPEDAPELRLLFVVDERVLTTTIARTAMAATPPMTEPMMIPRVEDEEGGELEGEGD